MTDAPKQDRWLDVKEMMAAHSLTIGAPTLQLIAGDVETLILRLSFFKLAAKLIGPDKRVAVFDECEGLGAWVIAKECGYAVGLLSAEATLAAAKQNFTESRIAFQSSQAALPTGWWDAAVRFVADAAEAAAWVDRVASQLDNNGVVVLGGEPGTAASLREMTAKRFHHVFAFCETLGIIPIDDRAATHLVAALGCRPRR